MIGQEEFLKIFEKSPEFSRAELIRFYRSVRKSIMLSYAGRKGIPMLTDIDQKYQWPVLRRMDDPKLSIFEGADAELLSVFLQTIQKQKKKNSWPAVREMAQKRARLYPSIFGLTREELDICVKIGIALEKKLIKKHNAWKMAIGFGTAGIVVVGAAAGAGLYLKKKNKKKT
jgi:hypothetical protein